MPGKRAGRSPIAAWLTTLRFDHPAQQDEPLRVCRRPICLRHAARGDLFQHGVVALLGFGRRDVADGLQQPSIVEPIHPFQRRELDGLERAPWSTLVDHLGLVETVNRFAESIVVAVADATDRRLDAGLRQALGVSNADVLAASDALRVALISRRR